jgi:hypothetical protein
VKKFKIISKVKQKRRIKRHANYTITRHPDSYYFSGPKMQRTHWYAVSGGWTPQPGMATPEEVERVGLHDCSWQGCEEAHAGTAEEYVRERLIREAREEAAAQESTRGRGSKGRKKLARRKSDDR